jgi:glycosyltransferase involved in cell wall biosynthesis
MKIRLVVNYQPDEQQSMLHYANEHQKLLDSIDCLSVHRLQFKPIFGRFVVSTTSGYRKWIGYLDKYIMIPAWLLWWRIAKPGTQWHILDHSNAPYLRWLPKRRTIITCHDVFAIQCALDLVSGRKVSMFGRLQQKWIAHWLAECRNIVFVSSYTHQQFSYLFPTWKGNSWIIPHAMRLPQQLEQCQLKGDPYLLHVGSSSWYKNRVQVLRVWKHTRLLGASFRLILVGPPLTTEESIEVGNLASDIMIVTNVGRAELNAIYAAARVFLFPSLVEGYGWPPLEAQSFGIPVVASKGGALAENLGGSAQLFHPGDTQGMAEACLLLAADGPDRDHRIAAGFANLQRFAPERIQGLWISCYESVL